MLHVCSEIKPYLKITCISYKPYLKVACIYVLSHYFCQMFENMNQKFNLFSPCTFMFYTTLAIADHLQFSSFIALSSVVWIDVVFNRIDIPEAVYHYYYIVVIIKIISKQHGCRYQKIIRMIFGRVKDFNIRLIMPTFQVIAFIGCRTANFQSLHSKALEQRPNLVFTDYHTKMEVNQQK